MANSYAENSTIELTTFSAGTPAKASEVNGNFEAMKAYIEQLEQKIIRLNSQSSTVPVYGDGKLIGYTNSNLSPTSNYISIHHDLFGELEIFSVDNNYLIKGPELHSGAIQLYSDNACSSPVLKVLPSSFLAVEEDNTLGKQYLVRGDNPYVAPDDVAIRTDDIPFYDWKYTGENSDPHCELSGLNDIKSTFYIELDPLSEKLHGLKPTYSTIKIGANTIRKL